MSIYQPNFLSPSNISVDADSSITFTAKVQGSYADAYHLIIYNMDNNIIVDTGSIPLSPILYQGESFSYTLNSGLTNRTQYKYTLSLFTDSLPINQCFSYNKATTTYTDETTDINSATANDVPLVPIATAEDAVYFGSTSKFSGVNINVGTVGDYVATLKWEYYNGSWIDIPLLTDNTSGFTASGMVLFSPPSDWATVAVNSSTKYWIRCRVSAFTSVTTAPLATQAWMKNSATSKEVAFYCYATPTVTMSVTDPLASKTATFTATYSQNENMPIVRWYMVFFDSSNTVVLQTSYSYSANISYLFDGFLNNTTYKVYTVVENQMNVITQSSTYTFDVAYSPSVVSIVPTATLIEESSAVQVDWIDIIQNLGVVEGTSSYTSDLFVTGNYGLVLNDSSWVQFDLDIPSGFTITVDYIPDVSFTAGVLVDFQDENGVYYQLGYDGMKFYYDIDGTIINGTVQALPTDVFLICVKENEALIILDNVVYEHLQ